MCLYPMRQTQLHRRCLKAERQVYGYRKLHDDRLDWGETSCAKLILAS